MDWDPLWPTVLVRQGRSRENAYFSLAGSMFLENGDDMETIVGATADPVVYC